MSAVVVLDAPELRNTAIDRLRQHVLDVEARSGRKVGSVAVSKAWARRFGYDAYTSKDWPMWKACCELVIDHEVECCGVRLVAGWRS